MYIVKGHGFIYILHALHALHGKIKYSMLKFMTLSAQRLSGQIFSDISVSLYFWILPEAVMGY